MPLADILQDPNYTQANAATKQAIFDKYAAQDSNYTQANAETQQAIRTRFGLGSIETPAMASESSAEAKPVSQVPEWGKNHPTLYGAAQGTRTALGPTVSALTTTGGAVLGTLGGPLGTVLGAGGGYAAGEGLMRIADVALGNEAPDKSPLQGIERGTKDILTGATLEAGSRVVAPYVAKGIGWLSDALSGQIGKQKAAKLLREAFGGDVTAVREAAKKAPEGMTAAQSIADLNVPAGQAALERASGRTPVAAANKLATAQAQEAARVNQLAVLAGGETQTATRTAQGAAKETLNNKLIPTLKTELEAANTAGTLKPELEGVANRMGQAAASKVEDVRRFTAAGNRAAEKATQQVVERGLPTSTARYTYTGELAKKAEQVAEQAANASLRFGEASQFAQAGADSLAAHGLKPLESKSIVESINNVLKKPEFAGNRDMSTALRRVAADIEKWTSQGGVIDAFALDSIRKNSVNAAIRNMYPAADTKVQKELAANILGKVRPLIVDAIEGAGGTGYRGYLEAYAKGAQEIAQQKLGGVALKMYQSDPQAFVQLVEGNSPKEVEKVFGAGSYDLAKEMSEKAMNTLKSVAGEVVRDASVKTQAAAGQQAYKELLDANTGKFKFPAFFSAKTTVANAVLDTLEGRVGKKVMDILTDASRSGKSLDALLGTMPAAERNTILKELANAQKWTGGATAGSVNALTPRKQNQNALIN